VEDVWESVPDWFSESAFLASMDSATDSATDAATDSAMDSIIAMSFSLMVSLFPHAVSMLAINKIDKETDRTDFSFFKFSSPLYLFRLY
jgi:hypothetical protein